MSSRGMPVSDWQAAFVLHSRAYRNSSLLVDVFSRDQGRFTLVAKGVRRKGRNPLQVFQEIQFRYSGRGELKNLSEWEVVTSAYQLQAGALACGFYLNELLLFLLHRDDPHPELYQHYANALHALSHADDYESCLRLFEKYLLAELGYGLILDHDIESGDAIDADTDYLYLLEQGPLRLSVPAKPGDMVIRGACLQALALDRLDDAPCKQQIKRLMRASLAVHLEGRHLKSRELFTVLSHQ